MQESEVYKQLTDIFSEVFMRDIELKPELTARDVPGWDSFKQIEIVIGVEERFGIKFNTRDLDGLRNVGDMARVIIDKTAANAT